MTKRLSDLIPAVPGARRVGAEGNPLLTGLSYDSRQVEPGHLFFCVRGAKSDGHQFLSAAVERGAVAAVVEEAQEVNLPQLQVENVRAAMPHLATAFFDTPARRLALVGVTGTNGKTTTTYLIESLARAAGRETGVIGTIGVRIGDEMLPADRTTPESPEVQALLARMADAPAGSGPRVVSMEVSSHALHQGRTLGCEFDVAVFTNLTQDHLDYHVDMESYFEAKAALFTDYPQRTSKATTAVVNVDDPYGRRLVERLSTRSITYGVEQEADLRASAIEASPTGVAFRLTTPEGEFPVQIRLGGLFNVYNSLAALGAGRALGLEWDVLLRGLQSSPGVPGRFESVFSSDPALRERQEFSVIVDYAHTPDGLENVLRAGRALNPRRLIAVFGCGGDRDRTKRPIMGRLAAELADRVIVTSDNPRTEEPLGILDEIVAGIPADRHSAVMTEVMTEVNRRTAIQAAIREAEAGDLVVIAGKGHETYQIFAHETVHFDDREEARIALDARLSS